MKEVKLASLVSKLASLVIETDPLLFSMSSLEECFAIDL